MSFCMLAARLLVLAVFTAAPPAFAQGDEPRADGASGEKPASAEDPAQGKVTTFAMPRLVSDARSLTIDAKGRVFISESTRSGCGVFRQEAIPEQLRGEALRFFTITDRAEALKKWSAAGSLDAMAAAAGLTPGTLLTARSEAVVLLSDTDGNSQADERRVVAAGFDGPVEGPAGVIRALSTGGLALGCVPDLWSLDASTDGAAARRRLANGAGVRFGETGISALVEGGDGYLYFGVSDRGYAITDWAGELQHGRCGAIFRVRPDGTGLELHARGLRRPCGLAFDDAGNLFAADEDPLSPDQTRLLLVLPGADFGWRADFAAQLAPGPFVARKMNRSPAGLDEADTEISRAVLPAAGLIPGRVGTLMESPGTVLPEALETALLICNEGAEGGLYGLRLDPEGAGWKIGSLPLLHGGTAWSDAAFSPDGALFHLTSSPGGKPPHEIRTLRWRPAADEVAVLLQEDLGKREPSALISLLEHPDRRVRLRAQRTAAAQPFVRLLDPLVQVARKSPNRLARLHAIRAIAEMGRSTHALLTELTLLLGSDTADVRAAAAHALGECGYTGSIEPLTNLLADEAPRVRLQAALALARLPCSAAFARIIQAIADNSARDPWLEHGLVLALARAAEPEELATLIGQHGSAAVRMAAVLAMRRVRAPQLAQALSAGDPAAAAEAARAIRDEALVPLFPALAETLATPKSVSTRAPVVLAALECALELGRVEDAERVAAFAAAPVTEAIPSSLRMASLDTLAAWDNPPERDRLTGEIRTLPARTPGLAASAFHRAVTSLEALALPDTKDRLAELKPRAVAPDAGRLAGVIADATRSVPERRLSFSALVTLNAARAAEVAATLVVPATPPELRADARVHLARRDPKSMVAALAAILADGTPPERQAAVNLLNTTRTKESDALLASLGTRLVEGTLPPEIRVEVLEGIQRRNVERRTVWHRLMTAWRAAQDTGSNPLNRWAISLGYGDPDAGRQVFESTIAGCSECHRVRGRGGLSGPSLDGIGQRRTTEQLLRALVHPSAEVATGYERAEIVQRSGRTLRGTIRQRDAAGILLSTPRGSEFIPGTEIREITPAGSPMPPVGEILTPRELRDLLAWLKSE